MDKQKVLLNSWYTEIPPLLEREMKDKKVKVTLLGQDKELTIQITSFFQEPVVLQDVYGRKISSLICGIVDQNEKKNNFIHMKSIETENYIFTTQIQ